MKERDPQEEENYPRSRISIGGVALLEKLMFYSETGVLPDMFKTTNKTSPDSGNYSHYHTLNSALATYSSQSLAFLEKVLNSFKAKLKNLKFEYWS